MLRTRELHPKGHGRQSPIAAVILTSGEIDAVTGLLSLREGHSFPIYAAGEVLAILADNPMFDALPEPLVARCPLQFDHMTPLHDTAGVPLGVSVRAFAVPGKVPLYAETGGDPGRSDDGVTIGLEVCDGGGNMFFIPGCAEMPAALRERLRGASVVLFDGTLWHANEMIAAKLSAKTGARMGHMSISGPDGVMAAFEGLGVRRRVFIHLNNTNPALLADSPERTVLQDHGWEVAYDGMELQV